MLSMRGGEGGESGGFGAEGSVRITREIGARGVCCFSGAAGALEGDRLEIGGLFSAGVRGVLRVECVETGGCAGVVAAFHCLECVGELAR